MWFGALVFCYPAIARLRQVSEHGAVPDLAHDNPRFNTRTTIVGPLARLLLSPHGVNYHVEHHLNPAIPTYRLSAANLLLKARGYFNGIQTPNGYSQVIKQLTLAS